MSASESIDDSVEKMRQQAAQRQQEDQIETVQNLGTKEWLQSKLEEQPTYQTIFDREFPFRPIGNEKAEEIIEMAAEEAKKTEGVDADNLDDIEAEDMEDMPSLLQKMRETLADHCLDDDMDAEAFGMLPIEMLEEIFEGVAASGNSPRKR